MPFFQAIAVLVGTIIGAGVLGMPYVVYRSGFLNSLVLLLAIFLAVLFIHLSIGEIALSTKDNHQLAGYAGKYLGNWGKYFMFACTAFGFYGSLLAYLIGEGQVLAALTGGEPMVYSLLFFLFAGLLVYLGLSVVKEAEFLMTLIMALIIAVISLWGVKYLEISHLLEFNWSRILLPYGVFFFALSGASAVPQLRQILAGRERQVKKAVLIGSSIPLIIYLLFIFIVVGVSGDQITQVATVGLGKIIGPVMVIFGNLFAFFAMATGFLTLGIALKNTYIFDFKVKSNLAWLLTVSVPVIIFLLGLRDFVKVIEVVGALAGGLQGCLIGLIILNLKKKRDRLPEYEMLKTPALIIFLSLMFLGGMVYTFWYL